MLALSRVRVVVVVHTATMSAEVVTIVELSVSAAQQISTRTSHFGSECKLLAVEN